MQGNLKKLEKELEIYKPLDDPEDKFIPVMKISFIPNLPTTFFEWEKFGSGQKGSTADRLAHSMEHRGTVREVMGSK